MDLRPAIPPSNRLATFNTARANIIAEVTRRVVDARVQQAALDSSQSLEYVLNEIAFHEIRRLEGENKKQAQRWHDLAHRLGTMAPQAKRDELRTIVSGLATDIAGNFNPRVFRFVNDILPPALSFLLNPISGVREGVRALGALAEQIRVEGPMETIANCSRLGTLVMTPTHSSNFDSIVLGFALNRLGLPPVTYGAGKNLFSNPLISYFMHNLGAYTVDRRLSYGLYKDVLKTYSTVLLEGGFHSLFFPGGTRSRSNFVENDLKLGLLGTTATAAVNNQRTPSQGRIFVVPVTINYRLVLEAETLIADHLAETGKSRYIIEDDEFSRIGRIFEFVRKTLAHEGSVILKFGTPLDPFGNDVDENGDSRDSSGRLVEQRNYVLDARGAVRNDPQRDSIYTRMLGAKIVASYRRNTVLLGTHLVARAYLEIAHQRTGVHDILKLMRLSDSALAVPVEELESAVEGIIAAVQAQPEAACLDSSVKSQSTTDLIAQTLHVMNSYHTKRVLYRRGKFVRVGSMKLLYYYRNRSAQVQFTLPSLV